MGEGGERDDGESEKNRNNLKEENNKEIEEINGTFILKK